MKMKKNGTVLCLYIELFDYIFVQESVYVSW